MDTPDISLQSGNKERYSSYASSFSFIVLASLASFITYSCMYGFRKPYTASSYDGFGLFGISYKSVLVITQALGYMSGKFYGIKFIATISPGKRARSIFVIIGIAWLSLLLFAIIPAPYNFFLMFINGFPLAMVWGLVFSYLEGRKVTEITGAILATSIIFASGLAKTVGKWLMLSLHISEWWMPFAAGLVFIVPLVICVMLLNTLPPPSEKDIEHRTLRKPMDKQDRKLFLKRFGFALIPIIISYGMLTILRDFSEDFSNELWKEVGLGHYASIFVNTSTLVSLIVLGAVILLFFIKNNYKAFQLNHVAILLGFGLMIGTTILYSSGKISPVIWMVAATSGLYLGYMPFNCFYFERLLAAYKVQGNVGFVMYIADSFGYLGTVLVLLVKEFQHLNYSWVSIFKFLFYGGSVIGIALTVAGWLLFRKVYTKN